MICPMDYRFAKPIRRRMKFANGYTLSVIHGGFAFGEEDRPYEAAVLQWSWGDTANPEIMSENPQGYLTAWEVLEIARKVKALPPLI